MKQSNMDTDLLLFSLFPMCKFRIHFLIEEGLQINNKNLFNSVDCVEMYLEEIISTPF